MTSQDRQRLVDQVSSRLRTIGWVASILGAAVGFAAVGFLIPIFHDAEQADELARTNLPWIVGFVIVGGIGLSWIFDRLRPRVFAWIVEDREPTPAEHERTLRWAERASLLPLIAWSLAAVTLAIVNFDGSDEFWIVILVVALLAGEATSALTYLLSERAMRPIMALALTAREPSRNFALGIRRRLLFTWSLSTGVPIAALFTVGIGAVTRSDVPVADVAWACVFFAAVAMIVGLYATMIAARAIADPVKSMESALQRVAGGELDTSVAIDDATEIGRLQAGFNRMAEGLRERERIRDLFGRHVGEDVAREALEAGVRFSGEEREVGALFVDLVGSTTMAVAMPPTEVVRLLNRFFRVVVEVIEAEGGLVNKFEGDAALCVFGAPVPSPDPAGQALRAARVLCERLEREVPEVGFGIGVSAGNAVAGNVGSERRFEYTVIGDPVNEAARLCDLAKEREGHIIASDAAFERASEDERQAWSTGEKTILRGRLDATGLAIPRA